MQILFSNIGNSISAMPGGAGILAAGYKGLYKMGGPLSMKDMHGKYFQKYNYSPNLEKSKLSMIRKHHSHTLAP